MVPIQVINTVSGHNIRLTNAHDENKSFSDNPLSSGVPSYVMQEEFSRYQGFWWQPKSDGKCKLLKWFENNHTLIKNKPFFF